MSTTDRKEGVNAPPKPQDIFAVGTNVGTNKPFCQLVLLNQHHKQKKWLPGRDSNPRPID